MHSEETAIYIILLVALVLLRWRSRKEGLGSFWISLRTSGWNSLFQGALTAVIYALSYVALVLASGRARLTFDISMSSVIATITSAAKLLAHILPEVLFTEMLFRGCLFPALLQKKNGLLTPLILTSSMFTAYRLLLHNPLPYWLVYAVNTFILSSILCLMVFANQSLMGALGKTLVFEVIQSLVFSGNPAESPNSCLILSLNENVFTGASGNIETSLGFSIVLVLGLAYEIRHMKKHHHLLTTTE